MSESHDYNALDMSVKGVEDKRAKREIANMNERRRMQNINSGFHSLRALLPHKHDGEKLSKAAILQHTSNYIYQLEQEITKLLSQNSELKRALGGTAMTAVNTNTPEWIKRFASEPPDCPSCKRRKFDDSNRGGGHQIDDLSPLGADGEGGSSTESSSEQDMAEKSSRSRGRQNGGGRNGGGGGHDNGSGGEQSLRKQLLQLEKQLEQERKLRRMFEEELGYHNSYSQKQGNNNNNSNGHHHQLEGRRYSGGSSSHHHNNNSSSQHHQQHQHHHLVNMGHHFQDSQSMGENEVEVATESIEIEMHSCPASPPDGSSLALSAAGLPSIITEQVSHSAAANAVYLANSQHLTPSQHSAVAVGVQPITATTAAAALEMNQKLLLEQQRSAAVAKQNAIALPIDMPFVAATEVVTVGEEEEKPILAAAAAAVSGENGTQIMAFFDRDGKVVLVSPAEASKMSQATSNAANAAAAALPVVPLSQRKWTGFEIKQEKDIEDAAAAAAASASGASLLPSNVRCSVITTALSAPQLQQQQQQQPQQQHSSEEDSLALNSAAAASYESSAASKASLHSRQNLNTIVEAIRHLEGDHLFNESPNKASRSSPTF
ncbi:dimerization activity protein [Tyrophagus putrescentiae]|nr:dimerization activity protein [Tyrophagus putrescentiae]